MSEKYTMITDEQFALANQRAEKKLDNSHVATAAYYDDASARITISLSSGLELSFYFHPKRYWA